MTSKSEEYLAAAGRRHNVKTIYASHVSSDGITTVRSVEVPGDLSIWLEDLIAKGLAAEVRLDGDWTFHVQGQADRFVTLDVDAILEHDPATPEVESILRSIADSPQKAASILRDVLAERESMRSKGRAELDMLDRRIRTARALLIAWGRRDSLDIFAQGRLIEQSNAWLDETSPLAHIDDMTDDELAAKAKAVLETEP